MLKKPFYDPEKTYEENYEKGPYGAFADGKIFKQKGEPQYEYLGQKVYLPFGIPAGPILNSKYVKAAFEKGFDLVVYKTVRSDVFPCHPIPNIVPLDVTGDLSIEKLQEPLTVKDKYSEPLTITNSFGVPSKKAEIWIEDVKEALKYEGRGQVLILSFMGTVRPNQTQEEFINDYILAGKLALQTGVRIIEANLSCPNIGNEGLVCYNLEVTEKIAKGLKKIKKDIPLILKVGYFQNDEQIKRLAEIADKYADSIAVINTLQGTIVDKNGDQALPGKNRLRSGVCGSAIKWAGLEMVKKLEKIRRERKMKFSIEGIGGVMSPDDYFEYKKAGANSVMSATGAMWNPHLAQEIKTSIREEE